MRKNLNQGSTTLKKVNWFTKKLHGQQTPNLAKGLQKKQIYKNLWSLANSKNRETLKKIPSRKEIITYCL